MNLTIAYSVVNLQYDVASLSMSAHDALSIINSNKAKQ